MHIFLAPRATECLATICPTTQQTPKAVNTLKTKDWKRAFYPPKAVNIVKESQLQEAMGTAKEHDKMTAG
jgi:hypothetical protein